jgi:hypothetical protein
MANVNLISMQEGRHIMNQLESTFEKRILKQLRASGYFAAHLDGGPGWPDVIAIKDHRYECFELKVLRWHNWRDHKMNEVFELSQPAFVLKYPMLEMSALIMTDDGIYVRWLSSYDAELITKGARFGALPWEKWAPNEPF